MSDVPVSVNARWVPDVPMGGCQMYLLVGARCTCGWWVPDVPVTALWVSGGRCTNIIIGPMWENPNNITSFFWLLKWLAVIMTNKNNVIYDCPTYARSCQQCNCSQVPPLPPTPVVGAQLAAENSKVRLGRQSKVVVADEYQRDCKRLEK